MHLKIKRWTKLDNEHLLTSRISRFESLCLKSSSWGLLLLVVFLPWSTVGTVRTLFWRRCCTYDVMNGLYLIIVWRPNGWESLVGQWLSLNWYDPLVNLRSKVEAIVEIAPLSWGAVYGIIISRIVQPRLNGPRYWLKWQSKSISLTVQPRLDDTWT